MQLVTYTELIRQLPYKDQAFVTQGSVWKPYAKNELFRRFYQETFLKNESITISRCELFSIAEKDPHKGIFATILWGYPKGYTRGFNMPTLFPRFLGQVEFLSERLSTQKSTTSDELKYMLSRCDGIGLSTLSKLLYFFNIKINGCRCLIMDARIIRVLHNARFIELDSFSGITEQKGKHYYADYLRSCAQLSKKYGYKPDQLELFLFMFGNNLKRG
jgi:hypothetical protein